MRKEGYIPKNDDKRVIKRFALFPITIYDECDPWLQRRHYERRWLETVYIEQCYETCTGVWNNYMFVGRDTYIRFRKENKQ